MRALISFISLTVLFGIALSGQILPLDMTVTKLLQESESIEQTEQKEKLFSSEDVLSTKKAFLFSLMLPGAGEFYCKSYIKSGAFFAVEVACWSSFFYFMNKYSTQRDEFRKFADDHWWESYWREWYDSLCTIADTNELGIEILPDTKTQQYYEMIGKYDWFVLGWQDVIERDDYITHKSATYSIAITYSDNPSDIHRNVVEYLGDYVHSDSMEHYMNMRSDANEQYTIAKYFIGAAIFNHVLSAFDAAWTAKRHNDRLYKGFTRIQSIEVRPVVTVRHGKPMPKILCTLKW